MSEQETGKTTDYVVMVAETVRLEADGSESWTGWRDVGPLRVPQRTQRVTLARRAAELVPADASPVRIRVVPADALLEASVELVRPEPQLEVSLR